MTREEAIEIIEIAKAETEWDYPLDYQIAFDEAIEALKEIEQLQGEKEYLLNFIKGECVYCKHDGKNCPIDIDFSGSRPICKNWEWRGIDCN